MMESSHLPGKFVCVDLLIFLIFWFAKSVRDSEFPLGCGVAKRLEELMGVAGAEMKL